MGKFNKRDNKSGRSNFSDKQMFKAICDKCHKECEVPFRPTGDKPIYCNECFREKSRDNRGSRDRDNRDRRDNRANTSSFDQYKKQFEMLNNKLDNILEILSLEKATKSTVKKEKPAVKKVEKKEEKKKKVLPKKTVKKEVKKKVAKKKK